MRLHVHVHIHGDPAQTAQLTRLADAAEKLVEQNDTEEVVAAKLEAIRARLAASNTKLSGAVDAATPTP